MKIYWTDGSAVPNPGKGGFAVLEIIDGVPVPVMLGTEEKSSNIRMEGKALIAAMKKASGEPCEIHTDSEFWINVLTKWAPTWQKNGWTKKSGPIKNLDIVQELYELYTTEQVKLVWVHGHSGVTYNELADEWANKARAGVKV